MVNDKSHLHFHHSCFITYSNLLTKLVATKNMIVRVLLYFLFRFLLNSEILSTKSQIPNWSQPVLEFGICSLDFK